MTGARECQPDNSEARQHTPTPWRVVGSGVWCDAGYVAELSCPRGPEQRDVDAAFIVEAANNHDTLRNNVAVMHKHMTGAATDIAALQARVEELTKALEFYAKAENWASPSLGFALQYDPELAPVQKDRGTLARSAVPLERQQTHD